jgi:hypothetical protein
MSKLRNSTAAKKQKEFFVRFDQKEVAIMYMRRNILKK